MPRRTRPTRRRGYTRGLPSQEASKPGTRAHETEAMARSLVNRGLASPLILDSGAARFIGNLKKGPDA